MSVTEAWLLKVLLGATAGLFTLLGAVLTFLEVCRNDDHEPVRAWFRTKWVHLSGSAWLAMPETVIAFLLRRERRLAGWVLDLPRRDAYFRYVRWCLPVLTFFSVLLKWGSIPATITTGAVLPFSFFIKPGLRLPDRALPSVLLMLYFTFCFGVPTISSILVALTLPVVYAALLMLVLLPAFWVVPLCFLIPIIAAVHVYVSTEVRFYGGFVLFSMGMAASFTVTYIAFLVGHIARPESPVPQHILVLCSNVLFDGCTLHVTFGLLRWAVTGRAFLRIPLAILVDLCLAALFACASLYLGLVFTKNALTIWQVLRVLVGLAPDGSQIELGPYFWAMHTAFLPSLLYLLLILLAWVGKAILCPVTWFFGKGQEHNNPLKLTATLCGVVAAFFYVAAFGAGELQRSVEARHPIEAPTRTTEATSEGA